MPCLIRQWISKLPVTPRLPHWPALFLVRVASRESQIAIAVSFRTLNVLRSRASRRHQGIRASGPGRRACAGGSRRCRQTRRRGRYLADPIQSTEVRRGRGVGIQVPPNRVALMTGGGNWLSFPGGDCAIRVPEEGGREDESMDGRGSAAAAARCLHFSVVHGGWTRRGRYYLHVPIAITSIPHPCTLAHHSLIGQDYFYRSGIM